MARVFRLACLVVFAAATGFATSGCGDDSKTGQIVDSPEAKKADQQGQDAMQEFIKSKSQKK